MLNPYPDRIEALHMHLSRAYGQRDREATEILLCAMLDKSVTGSRKPWVVIETDWPSRETRDAWFSFGGTVDVKSLSVPRVLRLRNCDEILDGWIDQRTDNTTGLYVDSEWAKSARENSAPRRSYFARESYRLFMSMCLKLKVLHPRNEHASRPQMERDAADAELARLARRVLDNSLRAPPAASSAVGVQGAHAAPAGLLYWCELAQRLSQYPDDWNTVTNGLATIARNVCTLYNDASMTPAWALSERLIRDSISELTITMLTRKMPKAEMRNAGRAYGREIGRLYSLGIKRVPLELNTPYKDWRALIDRKQKLFAL